MLTIVIPYKRGDSGLFLTLKSIKKYVLVEYEIIIVTNHLKKCLFSVNKKNISIIKQNGIGIYGAMNSALCYASREYIMFMGAGDEFCSNLPIEIPLGRYDVLILNVIFSNKFIPSNFFYEMYLDGVMYFSRPVVPYHASLIFRTDIHKKIHYDESYRMISDAILISDYLKSIPDYRVYKYPTASTSNLYIDATGISSNSGNRIMHLQELIRYGNEKSRFKSVIFLHALLILMHVKKFIISLIKS